MPSAGKTKKARVDPGWRRRAGLSMGLPVRHARRHILAIQKEPDRTTEAKRLPHNVAALKSFKTDQIVSRINAVGK